MYSLAGVSLREIRIPIDCQRYERQTRAGTRVSRCHAGSKLNIEFGPLSSSHHQFLMSASEALRDVNHPGGRIAHSRDVIHGCFMTTRMRVLLCVANEEKARRDPGRERVKSTRTTCSTTRGTLSWPRYTSRCRSRRTGSSGESPRRNFGH